MKNVFLLISVFLLSLSISAKTIYVTPDGNNDNTGTSWDASVKDLIKAYSLATAGDQIWMAGGTYTFNQTINMIDEVDVYGGFEKGATSIESRVRPDAENEPWKFASETVLTIEMIANFRPIDRVDKDTPWKGATIDGIVLKNIEAENARIAYFSDGVTFQNSAVINCSSIGTHIYFERNGVMRNCLMEGNYNQSGRDDVCLQLRGSKVNEKGILVDNCVFRNNSSQAISIYNTAPDGRDKDADDTHIVKNCSFLNNKHKCIAINSHAVEGRKIEITDCLFEGNETATTAGTSPDGMIITGSTGGVCTINRCIIRNNKNTISAESDWKNSLIVLNGTLYKLLNSLIINNTSGQLLFYCSGEVYNCTIANNEGSIYSIDLNSFMNNAIINNTPTEGKKLFFLNDDTDTYFLNNAVDPGTEIQGGGSAFEERGTIYTDISTFVSPTNFIGVAGSEAELEVIRNADFSLADNSVCKGTGDTEELLEFIEEFDFVEIFSAKDLVGNPRFTDGKINIGAYEGGKGPGNSIDSNQYGEPIRIYGTNGKVVIETEKEIAVSIYNITGLNIHNSVVNAGNTSISLKTKGIYLVKAGNNTYKVYIN